MEELLKQFMNEMNTSMEKMDSRFEQIDRRFDQIDNRFEQIDNRLDQMDKRFEQVDRRFDQMDKRFEQVDRRLDQMDKRFEQVDRRFEQMDKRFERLEDEVSVMGIDIKELKTGQDQLKDNLINGLGPYFEKIAEHIDTKTDELKDSIENQQLVIETLSARSIHQESEIKDLKRIVKNQ